MRELLGGKGANVAEMTRILGAERVPGGLHDHDRGVRRLHARRRVPRRARGAGRRGAGSARGARRQEARRRRRPAARLGALGRARVDARDARHGPQPRPQRRLGRGARDSARRTSASPGTPTGASCRCSATSCTASRASASRSAIKERQGRPRRRATTPSSTSRRCDELSRTFKGFRDETARTSRRTRASSCARRDPRRLRLVERRPRRDLPAASTASPTTGEPRSTSSRWSSATRATRAGPASRSAATR